MFRDDFVWGAASAAYQIEGAPCEDGKGLSVWDTYCHNSDRIYEGQTGDVACDHYHRYKEDVGLMKKMGLKAYRFSISWTRLLPKGIGEVNPKGIEFYNNLIDELLANGIEPYITLFHWDYPDELFQRGGWLNPESSDWFAYYTKVIAENFSDRVKNFITMNEPEGFICSHGDSKQAPGLNFSKYYLVKMTHNMLLSHGKAVQALRKYGKQKVNIGYAPAGCTYVPKDENNMADIEAARKLTFSMPEEFGMYVITWMVDPVIFGEYPEEGLKLYEKYLPSTWKEDLKTICQPLDFFGMNLYSSEVVESVNGVPTILKRKDGFVHTEIGWAIEPKSVKWVSRFYYERYKLPIIVTENGMSCHDTVSLDGKVHDSNRIDYLNRHLLKIEEAMEAGVDIRGYFQWSLTDNFEWTHGYKCRFGLIYVDFETQERIIKDSGYWYKQVIETNGKHLHDLPQAY